jgi:ribosomal protein S21|tara:strand:- start:419 stop:676 length:258 start_codon:yes stop_codon:yes gene_type:complete
MARKMNIGVKARPRENAERLIRRFIKKVKKEKIVEKFRENRYYNPPSIKKKLKRERAQRQRERDLAKLKKKQQRRLKNRQTRNKN